MANILIKSINDRLTRFDFNQLKNFFSARRLRFVLRLNIAFLRQSDSFIGAASLT